MTFAIEMDVSALWTFSSPEEAMDYCEIYDVAQGGWKFFADDGAALKPKIKPEGRFLGMKTGGSKYDLTETMLSGEAPLSTYLPSIRYLEKGPFKSVVEVEAYLSNRNTQGKP